MAWLAHRLARFQEEVAHSRRLRWIHPATGFCSPPAALSADKKVAVRSHPVVTSGRVLDVHELVHRHVRHRNAGGCADLGGGGGAISRAARRARGSWSA